MKKNKQVVEVVIDGKTVVYDPTKKDILKLKYYSENPRVHSVLAAYGSTPSQEEIQKELWDLDSTKDLYRNILSNRGIVEPIIVRNGFVLEGNSRLCAYRKLYENAKDNTEKKLWRHITAIDLPRDVTEKQIFQLLGTYHIRGKAKWLTFEKASYVYRMKKQFGMKEEDIAKDLGMSKTEVKHMIDSYTTMEREGVKDLQKFSYFMEFFKNRALTKICEKNPKLPKEFSKWVIEDQIPRAEVVRDLPKILNDKTATKSFYNESDFAKAKNIAFRKNPEHDSAFLRQLKKTTEELKEAEVPNLISEMNDDSKKRIITNFINEVELFKKNLKL